jgi:hypothetical protein
MAERTEPRRVDPTDEVGDEGGSTGEVELERTSVTTGSEGTSTVDADDEDITERRRPDRD